LLAGQLPFKGGHEAAVMYEIVHVEPPSPGILRRDIDEAWDHTVMKCLEKDPSKRYQNVREVSADLKKIQIPAEGIVMRGAEHMEAPGGASKQTGRQVGKSRRMMMIAVATVIALLGLAALYLFSNRGSGIESL